MATATIAPMMAGMQRARIVTTLRSLELNATSPLRKSGSPPPALSRSSGGALRLRRALSEARRPDDRPRVLAVPRLLGASAARRRRDGVAAGWLSRR